MLGRLVGALPEFVAGQIPILDSAVLVQNPMVSYTEPWTEAASGRPLNHIIPTKPRAGAVSASGLRFLAQ